MNATNTFFKKDAVTRTFFIALGATAVFTLLTYLLGPRLLNVPHLPDKGPAWYFWKLAKPTLWSHLSAWGGYLLHQASILVIVVLALKEKPHPDRISPLNIAALVVNGFFILLHLLQTHLFYDGLAQDVPIWTSQFSVIIMLVIILFLLNPRRGMFWGVKVPWGERFYRFVAKYHGIYIAWALVYTFWFHPMEGVYGLLVGFFYMFMLLMQLSLFGTRIHYSIGWITTLEFTVGVHGPIIAIFNGQAAWPMFLFGFLAMFVFTQVHGLTKSKALKFLALAAWVAGVAVVYLFRGYGKLYELTFIPFALWGGAMLLFITSYAGKNIKKGTAPVKG